MREAQMEEEEEEQNNNKEKKKKKRVVGGKRKNLSMYNTIQAHYIASYRHQIQI